ncbi:LOW QUALITY PROTEIN: uncharacterized protein V3H86_015094 [Mergus octosetaceus]
MALNAGAEAEAEPRWEPVPAAELRSRRERQDRVSQALGRYLLRGYRMLGSCCPRCGTILLQDKQQQLHCVTCHELDGERDGDALEAPPAAPQPAPPCHPAAPRPEHCEGAASGRRGRVPQPAPPGPEVAAAAAAVLQKLGWAARELPRTASVEGSAQLCALVRACAEALRALRGARRPPRDPPGTPKPIKEFPSTRHPPTASAARGPGGGVPGGGRHGLGVEAAAAAGEAGGQGALRGELRGAAGGGHQEVPDKLVVVWTRRNRRVCSKQPHSWQPGIENPYRGMVVLVPESVDVVVTLYRDPHATTYDEKEWTFLVENESRGRRSVVAGRRWTWGAWWGPAPTRVALALPLRPRSRKVAAASLRLSLSATLLHEGHPTDEDMRSVASLLSSRLGDVADLGDFNESEEEERRRKAAPGGGRAGRAPPPSPKMHPGSCRRWWRRRSRGGPPPPPGGGSRRASLLAWCQEATAGYRGVRVTNFSTSWRSGLAFCALLHRFRPHSVDFEALDPLDIRGNNKLAFAGFSALGVPRLLDPADLERPPVPDALGWLTYLGLLRARLGDPPRSPPGTPPGPPEPGAVAEGAGGTQGVTDGAARDAGRAAVEGAARDHGSSAIVEPAKDAGSSAIMEPARDAGSLAIEGAAKDAGSSANGDTARESGSSAITEPAKDAGRLANDGATKDDGEVWSTQRLQRMMGVHPIMEPAKDAGSLANGKAARDSGSPAIDGAAKDAGSWSTQNLQRMLGTWPMTTPQGILGVWPLRTLQGILGVQPMVMSQRILGARSMTILQGILGARPSRSPQRMMGTWPTALP